MQNTPFHIKCLKSEFEKRRAVNSRYSLRAYAKQLKMHPSAVCRILASKQELSLKGSVRVIRALRLSSAEATSFIDSIVQRHAAKAANYLKAELLKNATP